MQIKNDVLNEILHNVPQEPPEIGGILGGVNDIIFKYRFDIGISKNRGCFYSPNVVELNRTISSWNSVGIDFYGIFHTHFFGVQTLSAGDILYIRTIMRSMPKQVNRLYFPVVVLPQRVLIPYLAMRSRDIVEIKTDDLIVV